jgi:hypothetical protein
MEVVHVGAMHGAGSPKRSEPATTEPEVQRQVARVPNGRSGSRMDPVGQQAVRLVSMTDNVCNDIACNPGGLMEQSFPAGLRMQTEARPATGQSD